MAVTQREPAVIYLKHVPNDDVHAHHQILFYMTFRVNHR